MKTSKRIGDWFQTYSGVRFYPLDPRPEDIRIEDIAHSLARICRFGGHTKEFYSVAQHSVLVSRIVLTLEGLMHDATEAYCGDVVRPLKYAMPNYREIEDRIWIAVAEQFGLSMILPPEVKRAENTVLVTERRDLLQNQQEWGEWTKEYTPLSWPITPESPEMAEANFLSRFKELA